MIDILNFSIRLLFINFVQFIALVNISKQRVSFKELLFVLMLIELVDMFLYIMFGSEILLNVVVAIISVLFLYYKKRHLLLSIFYTVITIIISLTINNAVSAIFYYTLQKSVETMRENEFVYWSLTLISAAILIFISYVLGNFFKNFLFLFSKDIKNKFIIYILLFLLISLSIFYFNVLYVKDDANNSILFLINAILLALDFIFIVFIFHAYFRAIGQSIEINHKEELLRNLNEYVSSIENMNEDMRSFRHDVKNVLSSLYIYIEEKDLPGLESYFMNSIVPVSSRITDNSAVMEQLKHITVHELKGTLAVKFINAMEQGIDIHIEVQDNVEIDSVGIIDLVKMVGILLDNAIEECQKAKGMKLQFALFEKNHAVKMIFVNPITDQPPEVARLFERDYSTKGTGRGIGLSNLQKIIDAYDHVMLRTYIESNEFVQEVTIT